MSHRVSFVGGLLSSVLLSPEPLRMPRVFLGNFDFEHELAAGRNWQAGATLRRINAELSHAWLAVAGPEDVIVSAGLPDEAYLQQCTEWLGWRPRFEVEVPDQCQGWELLPWGWSEKAVAWGTERSVACVSPEIANVRDVNDRLFSHRLEMDWGVGLDGAAVIRSRDDLLAQFAWVKAERWVLKARFGMSGRERCLGRGEELPTASQKWLETRIARDGAVVFEPWVEKVAESGLQFDVPRDGQPRFLGMTPLLSDVQGRYRGNRLDSGPAAVEAEWQSAVRVADYAACEAQQRGYFGPLGIDAMQYRDRDGSLRFRPLQDINARWTMGRLTLGWRRMLRAGECATWLHGPLTGATMSEVPAGCRIFRTSPRKFSGAECRHASLLLIAETAEKRCDAEAAMSGLSF